MTRRKFLSVLLGITAAYAALCVLAVGCSSGLVEHGVDNSRKIGLLFDSCIVYVEHFRQQQGRLPSEAEYYHWTHEQWIKGIPGSQRPYSSVGEIDYQVDSMAEEAIEEFGPPLANSYLLSMWRGEWVEYYASWTKRSTLNLQASDYSVFGSSRADGIGFSAIATLLALGAFKAWPRRRDNPEAAG